MNKTLRTILICAGILLLSAGAGLYFRWLDAPASALAAAIMRVPVKPSWSAYFPLAGIALFLLGLLVLFFILVQGTLARLVSWIGGKLTAFDRGVSTWVAKLPNPGVSPAPADRWPKFERPDWFILAIFLVYGLLIFLGTIQGNFPYPLLGGDEGNTANFAAGFDRPDLFQGDMLLSDPRNFIVYSTFNVSFMRWLFPLVGSYPLALAVLIPFQVFLQLTGFYLFGRILFGSRLWGIALTCLLALDIPINLGERWSLPVEALARFNFQAMLPYVLCMIVVWRTRPARWPWIMAATGVLFYLHPVSTPSWAVAIWLSLFFLAPREWKFWKRVGYMFVMGLIFLIISLPYIITYLGNHVQGRLSNYDLPMLILTTIFPENLLNIPAAVEVFLGIMSRNGLLYAAVLGLVVVLVLRRTRREPLAIFISWCLGIALMTTCVPFVMHSIEERYRLIPTETEMVRAIRYFIPMMILIAVWAAYEISLRLPFKPISRPYYNALVAAALIGGIALTAPLPRLQSSLSCLAQGRLICNHLTDYDQLIQAVKADVPEKAPIFATFGNSSLLSYGMPFRYIAQRPLAYAMKDRGMLVYDNSEVLSQWYDIYQQTIVIDRLSSKNPNKPAQYLALAKSLGARYIAADNQVDFSLLPASAIKPVYQNDQFSLVQIMP
jgi:hypothetical protein